MLRALTLTAATLLGSLQLPAAVSSANVSLTRAEAVMLMLKSNRVPLVLDQEPLLFADTLEGEWYVPYLKTAVKMGMIEADAPRGLLHPHGSVSRGDLLKMATIGFGLETDLPYPYTDVPAQSAHARYAGIAQRYGIFANRLTPLLLYPDLRLTQDEAVGAIATIIKKRTQNATVSTTLMKKELQRYDGITPPAPQLPGTHSSSNLPVSPTLYATGPRVVKSSVRTLLAQKSNTIDDVRLDILQRVNAERRKAGMHILRHNVLLAEAAQRHARDMQKRGYFSHFTPEGLSYVDRIRDVGYLDKNAASCPCTTAVNTLDLLQNRRAIGPNYVLMKSGDRCECLAKFALGENIAKGQMTPAQVVDDWMRSENHRNNILSGAFDEIGIGIFGNLWVQNFGKLETQ